MRLTFRSLVSISFLLSILPLILLSTNDANAWGKRGHSIVCQSAAYLAAREPNSQFLKSHSFDLAYYCNVPDIVWKKPATYEVEWTNHFMDLEIFERAFKAKSEEKSPEKPYEMDRLSFNSAYPEVAEKAGRSWWRIRELNDSLTKINETLNKSNDLTTDPLKKAHHKAQADWLVHAGVIGHYVGDLSQPLHVTENYDGQMTDQKGIHAFYEDTLVDELFSVDFRGDFGGNQNQLEAEVMKSAEKLWKKNSKKLQAKSFQALLVDLSEESIKELPELLKTDKKVGRGDIKKAARAHRTQIIERLASGAVTLAEIYRRQTGWNYNGERFYTFVAEPEYLYPPKAEASSQTENAGEKKK